LIEVPDRRDQGAYCGLQDAHQNFI